MPNKANLARRGRGIDEGLLMIDYWERRAIKDGKAAATMTNKANFRTPAGVGKEPKMQNEANFPRFWPENDGRAERQSQFAGARWLGPAFRPGRGQA